MSGALAPLAAPPIGGELLQVCHDRADVLAVFAHRSADGVRDAVDGGRDARNLDPKVVGDLFEVRRRRVDVAFVHFENEADAVSDAADVLDDVFHPLLACGAAHGVAQRGGDRLDVLRDVGDLAGDVVDRCRLASAQHHVLLLGEERGAGAAGEELDVFLAEQSEVRDLRRRSPVKLHVSVDFEGDQRFSVLGQLDVRDLAHPNAGYAHGRLLVEPCDGVELDLDLFHGGLTIDPDVFDPEDEEPADQQDHQHDRADFGR
jgi:hypothetical protein